MPSARSRAPRSPRRVRWSITSSARSARDRAAWREGRERAAAIRDALAAASDLAEGTKAQVRGLGRHEELTAKLTGALSPDLPHLARDGGFIAKGWNARLDELRGLRDEA